MEKCLTQLGRLERGSMGKGRALCAFAISSILVCWRLNPFQAIVFVDKASVFHGDAFALRTKSDL